MHRLRRLTRLAARSLGLGEAFATALRFLNRCCSSQTLTRSCRAQTAHKVSEALKPRRRVAQLLLLVRRDCSGNKSGYKMDGGKRRSARCEDCELACIAERERDRIGRC